MTETKSVLKSKTIWGALISLIGGLGVMFKWDIPTSELNNFVAYILDNMDAAMVVIGPILTYFGRRTADTKVTLTGK